MKIRNKLSLLFTVLTAAILAIFAALVYYSAAKSREFEFYKSLKKEAITKANLFFSGKVDVKTLQTIYKNNRGNINEVETAIYDTSFRLLYHDAVDIDFVKETRQMIDDILAKHEIRFYQDDWQVMGLLFTIDGKNYIVTAAAYDQHGYSKMSNLGKTFVVVFIFSIALIYLAGQFFSRRVLLPITDIVHKVKDITATNLDMRLAVKNMDEVGELGDTFNQMLDRLEKSFDAQKGFVSHISHELRTPLAAIISELQLSANKERTKEEYKAVIQNALSDAQKLVKLANSLLDFAKASYDPSEISFKEIRLDELLLDAQEHIVRSNSKYTVSIQYETVAPDEAISISGNEYLLERAFINLMENACKFSADHHCEVTISAGSATAEIQFKDNGAGISEHDLPHLFIPFFRGQNSSMAEGNGIGLALTQKIITLHKGFIEVLSVPGSGTSFKILLPR